MPYVGYLMKKMVHLNLKPTNIFLLDNKYRIRLTDFRELLPSEKNTIYLSPEFCGNNHPDFASDLYSFGIIMWEILNKKEASESPTVKCQMYGKEFLRPEWINDLKYDIYKNIYELLTTFDKKERIDKLSSKKFSDDSEEVPYLTMVGGNIALPGIIKSLRSFQTSIVNMPSEVGSYIWDKATENEKTKESTSWDKFYDQFQSKFSVIMSNDSKDKKYQCFRLMLDSGRRSSDINKKIWENFSNWFNSYLTSDDKVNELIDWIHDVYRHYWFHGFIDSDGTEDLLKDKELKRVRKQTNDIFYLVRLTPTPGVFGLNYSMIDKSNNITHNQEDITIDLQFLDKIIPTIDQYVRAFKLKYKRFRVKEINSKAVSIFHEGFSSKYVLDM